MIASASIRLSSWLSNDGCQLQFDDKRARTEMDSRLQYGPDVSQSKALSE